MLVPTRPPFAFARRPARIASAATALALAFCGAAVAQENFTSPPEALQFPFETQANARGELSISIVRQLVEGTVDNILCKRLMRQDGRPIPEPFVCEPAYRQRVATNQGDVRWASGARPTECGQSCFGRPSMTAQDNRTRPNLRRAHMFAWVKLRAGPRDLSYPLDIYFTCNAQNGALSGNVAVEAKAGPPAIGDAGFLESLGSFFTAGYLSSAIESEIRSQLPALSSRREELGGCRSIGALRAPNPAEDLIKFDLPAPSSPLARRVNTAAVAGALNDQVRVEFLRIVRNPLPVNVDQGHGRPGAPESAQFTVFLNGASHFFPPQGLILPVSGGAAPINFCTTMDVTAWNRLQVLFTNDLGGAAWSQFPRAQNFGNGTLRRLTTSRSIVVPGLPGPPDPITGQSRPARPRTVVLNEFELIYRITFAGRPTVVAQPTTPAQPVRPGLAGAVLGTRPQVAVDTTAPPQTPCRQI